MPHFKLEPQYSSSWTQRICDRFRPRKGKYEVSHLEAFDGETAGHLYTPVPGDVELQVPLEPLKLGCQQNRGSRLLQLPPELLIHVMRFVSHSSRYMMSQTCQLLRELENNINFDSFYQEFLQLEGQPHRLVGAMCDEVRLVKRILLRRSLCGPCGSLFDTGELETRLRRLWQPIRCAGCNKNHPELLFPQDTKKDNICVGLLGHFDLCKHVKVSAKLQPNCRDGMYAHCRHPDHYAATSKGAEKLPHVTSCHPWIRTSYSKDIQAIKCHKSFPMVKINQRQFPGMAALQACLLKQLQENGVEGLCQHASTQIDSIVSCMVSDKCNCFPASGKPVHKLEAPYGPGARCPNHGYNCRHCGARYFWMYEGDYIVLRLLLLSENIGPDSFGWLSNLTFDTDEHPIFNDNTKGVLWCDDPACGTGCGTRWLLMVEILKRTSLRNHGGHRQVPWRDRKSALKLPLTLEYKVFQEAAQWPTPRNMLYMDLTHPISD